MHTRYILLFSIVCLGLLLRFVNLGKVPASLEWDEVAIGYDAYSLLKTGRDQFGQVLPLTFRSLDDWKPPTYEYLTLPVIALFGLSAFSTRLSSAIFGVIAVFAVYYLVKEFFDELDILVYFSKEKLALVSAFFLALSPWHIQFSRAAFEVNVALTLICLAVIFFLKSLRKRNWQIIVSIIFFGLSLFSYHSARVIAPILFLSLVALFWRSVILFNRRTLLVGFIVGISLVIVFLPIVFSKEAQIRFAATNILYHRQVDNFFVPGIPQQRAAKLRVDDEQRGYVFSGKIVHNERIAFLDYELIQTLLKNYLSHFDPSFLFIRGDVPLHHAPGYGLMHPWDALFIPIGVVVCLFFLWTRRLFILILWFLIAAVPASITWQVPHAVRAELFLPSLQIFTAAGFLSLLFLFQKESRLLSKLVGVGLGSLLLFNIFVFMHQYFIHTNSEVAREWLYGREQAALYADSLKEHYQQIVVSTKLEQPHIFFLFYLAYDPTTYLREGGTVSGGYSEQRNHFGKYYFHNFEFATIRREKSTLLIGLPSEFPPDSKVLRTIHLPDGTPIIKIVEA